MKYRIEADGILNKYIAINIGRLTIIYSTTFHKFYISWYRMPIKHAYKFYNQGRTI